MTESKGVGIWLTGPGGAVVGVALGVAASLLLAGFVAWLVMRQPPQPATGAVSDRPQTSGAPTGSSRQDVAPSKPEIRHPFINAIGMKLLYIKPGEFLMGSPSSEAGRDDHEGPQHIVRITKGFYMATTEVTQGQWKAVMGTLPWSGGESRNGDDYPASNISWDDATEFCKKLSNRDGKRYRLPTQGEWEYACRAGTTSRFSFGDDPGYRQLGNYAWCAGNTWDKGEKYAHMVDQKISNPWGLYDMHGNVYEWCSDWYAQKYPAGPQTDPSGPSTGTFRVLRGGSWLSTPRLCRSAFRTMNSPYRRYYLTGFRVALDLSE